MPVLVTEAESDDKCIFLLCCACDSRNNDTRLPRCILNGISKADVKGTDVVQNLHRQMVEAIAECVMQALLSIYYLLGKRPPLGGPLKGLRDGRALERVLSLSRRHPNLACAPNLLCLIRLRARGACVMSK